MGLSDDLLETCNLRGADLGDRIMAVLRRNKAGLSFGILCNRMRRFGTQVQISQEVERLIVDGMAVAEKKVPQSGRWYYLISANHIPP